MLNSWPSGPRSQTLPGTSQMPRSAASCRELLDPRTVQRLGGVLQHLGALLVRVAVAEQVELREDHQPAVRLGGEGGFDLVREGRDGFADEPWPGLGGDEGKGALHGFISTLGM